MSGDPLLGPVVGLAGVVGLAVLIGFWVASWTNPSPTLLSCCVGAILGIIFGAIVFEFLPALEITFNTAPLKLSVAGVGFVVAAAIHRVVLSGLPGRHSFEEAGMSSFILAVVMDDVVEGLTLGFASALSVQLLLFSAVVFLSKNILEGFTEATVLRWQEKRAMRTWAAGVAAVIAVVLAAVAALWLSISSERGSGSRQLLFAASTGALLYVSVVELARNLEWNRAQKVCALLGFVATGVITFMVEAR